MGTDGLTQQWTKAGPVAGPLPAPDLERLQETQEAGSALVINAVYGRTALPLFGKA